MKTLTAMLTSMLLVAAPAAAKEAPPRPDQLAFRDLYKELVETNTTLSSGSCTLAAERMAARLKAAGIPESQLTLFATPENPKEGGLVAVYPGTSKSAKPILLVAHIDVVEAKREADAALRESGLDWTIIRPGRLTDDPGTGLVSLGSDVPRGDIPRADVASVLATVLASDDTIGQQWNLVSGVTPIAEAVQRAAGTR